MLSPAEEKIRILATSFGQTYVISLFACCRELYNSKNHSGCIEAKSLAEAIEKFEQLREEARLKQEQENDYKEQIRVLQEKTEKLEALLNG